MTEEKWFRRIFYVLAFGLFILVLYLAHLLAGILIPLVLAMMTLLLLHPFIRRLQKSGMPRFFASTVTMTLFFVFVMIILGVFYFSFHQFVSDLPVLLEHLNRTFLAGIRNIAGQKWVQQFANKETLIQTFSKGWKSINSGQTIIYTLLGTLNLFKGVGLYLVYLIFMSIWVAHFGTKIDKAFPYKSFKIKKVISRVTGQLQSYIFVKTMVSLLTGMISLIVCLLFGVHYAFLWGFVFFIFNFIPYIGSTVAVSLPVAVSIVQFQSFPLTIALFIILVLIQQLIGSILDPILQSDGANLSPFVIVLSLLLLGYIWGIAGVILAIPIMSALNMIFDSIDTLKPVSILMSVSRRKKRK